MTNTESKNPNILIFMADQYRGDMAPPFNKCITPNIDRIYKDGGISFTNAYCPSPHCCPSRATFHTGLYPSQHGVWNNVNVGNTLSQGLNDGVKTWGNILSDSGYKLYHSGKWHISNELGPKEYGWIDLYGYEKYKGLTSHRPAADPYEWSRYIDKDCATYLKGTNPQDIREESQLIREGYPLFKLYGNNENPFNDEKTVSAAEEQLQKCCKNPGQPFVLYCGCLGPHDPYMVPQRFLDLYDIEDISLPENINDDMQDKPNLYKRTKDRFSQLSDYEYKEAIRHYMALCSYEDWLFGRLLNVLDETGQFDNTIIIFTSDHGDYCGEHGLFAKGLPCFKSAYHIPFIMRWHKVTDKRTDKDIRQFISLADFAPTILDIANIQYDQNSFTGKSLMPIITEDHIAINNHKNEIYTQTNGNELYGIQRSIMTQQWKYVYNGFDYDELYNLIDDPYEMKNVAKKPENREVLRELSKKLWTFAYKTDDTCINPYIMVSLSEFGPGIIFEK